MILPQLWEMMLHKTNALKIANASRCVAALCGNEMSNQI